MLENVYLPGTKELDTSKTMTLNDMFKEFNLWFKEMFPGLKVPERGTFKTEIGQRLGVKPSSKGWLGIQLKTHVAIIDTSTSAFI